MCVIVTGVQDKPTWEDLQSMETANGHGNGIAWYSEGVVHYEKGIKLERLHELLKAAPFHWAIHFRIQTVGGEVAELCHPFPIHKESPCDLVGTCDEVLFHNGHIHSWEEITMKSVAKRRPGVPKGPWSDSRAMAWLISFVGRGVLNFAGKDNKFALMSKDGIRHYPADNEGWTDRNGYKCSNTLWVGRGKTTTSYGSSWGGNGRSCGYQGPLPILNGREQTDRTNELEIVGD